MRKFYINFLSLSLFSWGLAACSSNDEPAADELQFFLQSSIGGVSQAGGGSMSRTPQLDAQGQGTFSNGDVNTVFFLTPIITVSKIFLIRTAKRIIGMIFN